MANELCEAFQKNGDGSWTCLKSVAIIGPSGPIQIDPGRTFKTGEPIMGVDVAIYLEQNCSSWMARKE